MVCFRNRNTIIHITHGYAKFCITLFYHYASLVYLLINVLNIKRKPITVIHIV